MIHYKVDGRRATITIDDPKRRSPLSGEVLADLVGLTRRACADPAVGVVVCTGAGEAASRQAATWRRASWTTLWASTALGATSPTVPRHVAGRQAHGRPRQRPRPGRRVWPGRACDITVCVDDARLGTPEIGVGLWPMMISVALTRSIIHEHLFDYKGPRPRAKALDISWRPMQGTLVITGDEAADHLINTDANALVIGMLLDQQVPMGWAFRGPATLHERLGHLDPLRIAAMDEGALVEACRRPTAIHRFPQSMGERIHQLCVHLAEHHGGSAESLWSGEEDAGVVFERISALPGYGAEKSRILLAILAKRFGVRPQGWEALAGSFADDTPRSAADVDGPESLAAVRSWKQSQRAAKKSKQD